MTNNLTNNSDAELRELLQASRETLAALIASLANRPDMQEAVRILMRPDDMLETFVELAVKDPDLMRILLQASVAALLPHSRAAYGQAAMRYRCPFQSCHATTPDRGRLRSGCRVVTVV